MADQAVSTTDVIVQAKPALSATSDAPQVETAPPAEIVETPAVEATGAEAGEETPVVEGEKGKDETPAWMKAKITKEANKRRDAEQKATVAETRAASLEANLTKALTALEQMGGQNANRVAKDIEAQDPRPLRDKFDSPDAYDTALIDWSGRRAALVATAELQAQQEAKDTERKTAEQKAQTDKHNQEVADAYSERKTKFMDDHPDYEELVESDDLKISIPMSQVILNDEDGPAIAYYLGQNPDEAARISKLIPVKAIAELGRIAARLNAKPTVSTKPAPIKPLNSGSAPATRKSANEESMEEYAARRSAEIRGNGASPPH